MVFRTWAADLWILREIFLLALSKLHSPLLKSRFWWKKEFCWKICNFNFFGVREIFSYFWQQRYGRLAKRLLCMFIRTIWWISFLESLSFFLRFPIPSKSFQKFDENVLTWLSQLCSACPDEDFFSLFEGRKREKFFFSKKLHCYLFQTLNEKDPQCLLQAWLGQACQKIVVQVQTNIFANRFFAKLIIFSSFQEFQQKVFNALTRNFWQDCHN